MKGQEVLITELGQVFTALNKAVWTDSRNKSSQLWNLEGIIEKGSAVVVVSFSEKIPIFNGYSYISLTLVFCSQDHKHKKHFSKRTCF